MKKIILFSAVALGSLGIALPANAQLITWGAATNMVGTSDISTLGTFVDAIDFSTTEVIGDTTFTAIANGGSSTNIQVTDSAGVFNPGPNFTATPASTAYTTAVQAINFGIAQAGTVSLSGLTVGDTYQVQVWASYTSAAAGADLTTLTGSNTVTLTPENHQFALGTFTATGATDSFQYLHGTTYSLITDVAIRDVSAAPEPSEVLLLGMGLAGLAVLVRRQRSVHA